MYIYICVCVCVCISVGPLNSTHCRSLLGCEIDMNVLLAINAMLSGRKAMREAAMSDTKPAMEMPLDRGE